MIRRLIALLLLSFPVVAHAADQAERDTVMSALTGELDRSITMQMPGFDTPYFVSYRYTTSSGWAVGARFGALFEDYPIKNRGLFAEVRVGDYGFDSSGTGGMSSDMHSMAENRLFYGPLETDAQALRGQLWLATDQAYKNALSQYMSKKSDRIYSKSQKEKEPYDDFSHEDPVVWQGESVTMAAGRDEWADFVKEITTRLDAVPEIVENYARASVEMESRYFVNSEGSRIVEEDALFSFMVRATVYSDDGMRLDNMYIIYVGSDQSMPSKDDLRAASDKMVADLLALRQAPIIDPISAPAILDAETTGVFFHEAIGHRLEGERMRDTQEGQTFKGKVGESIVPSFITVVDDPTRRRIGKMDLNGTYHYDDEGVAAQNVVLIENGVLRNFLMSRAPIPGVPKSNGHGRSDGKVDPMGRMANLIVESKKTVSPAELKKQLLKEVRRQGKPYGLILKNSRGGETMTGRVNFQAFMNMPQMIYKVDAKTGDETLVRGASLVGTPLVSISKILMTDDQPGVFNGFCGAESGFIPVSAAAPAALVSEIELQRSVTQPKRPPILPSPFAK